MDVITNTGPHVHRATTPDIEAWIKLAPIVKAFQDVYPLTIAAPDAWRIFRVEFPTQDLDADPNNVANAVLAKLGTYRHSKLYVEMYVGLSPQDAVKHAALLRAFQDVMHVNGVKVCGPSWYDGNGDEATAKLFDFVDAYATQGYWGNTPVGTPFAQLPSRAWHAFRYRKLWPNRGGKPLFLVEVGRDYLPDEGTNVAGWQKQGVSIEAYVDEITDADAEYRADGVYAVVYSAGTFDVPADPANQGPFDTAPIAKAVAERTVWSERVDEPAALNPWRGVGLIVWKLPDDPADVVRKAALIGARYVDIKVHDGDSPWGDNRNVTRAYVEALRAAGLGVTGWGYVYCDSEPANGRDRGNGYNEWVPALERVSTLGLDGYSADFEIEAEHNASNVSQLLEQLAPLRPKLGAFVWATLHGHEGTPAEAICRGVDVLRPMVYQPVWSMDQFYDDFPTLRSWHSLWNGATCPAVGVTDKYDIQQLQHDLWTAYQHNAPGISVWELSGVADDERAAVLRAFGQVTPPPVDDTAAKIDNARQRALAAGGDLVNLGLTAEGYALQYVVKLGKGETQ